MLAGQPSEPPIYNDQPQNLLEDHFPNFKKGLIASMTSALVQAWKVADLGFVWIDFQRIGAFLSLGVLP